MSWVSEPISAYTKPPDIPDVTDAVPDSAPNPNMQRLGVSWDTWSQWWGPTCAIMYADLLGVANMTTGDTPAGTLFP